MRTEQPGHSLPSCTPSRAEGGDTALSLALAQGHQHAAEFLRRNGAKA
ncbi:hypothetical protein [Paenibacillus dendritiformis]|nr:hypothetical protein [Paenibacillus dendritiformis]